jgi:hypothetical protein
MKYKLWHLLSAVLAVSLLFGVGTSYPDKYHYQQQVDIVGGFYMGQSGYVEKRCLFGRYVVVVHESRYGDDGRRYIFESDLKPASTVKPNALLL